MQKADLRLRARRARFAVWQALARNRKSRLSKLPRCEDTSRYLLSTVLTSLVYCQTSSSELVTHDLLVSMLGEDRVEHRFLYFGLGMASGAVDKRIRSSVLKLCILLLHVVLGGVISQGNIAGERAHELK